MRRCVFYTYHKPFINVVGQYWSSGTDPKQIKIGSDVLDGGLGEQFLEEPCNASINGVIYSYFANFLK